MLRHQPIIRFECGISLEGSLDLLSLRESEGELVLSILILSYLQLSCVPTSISHEPGRRQKKRGTKSVTKTTLKLGGGDTFQDSGIICSSFRTLSPRMCCLNWANNSRPFSTSLRAVSLLLLKIGCAILYFKTKFTALLQF